MLGVLCFFFFRPELYGIQYFPRARGGGGVFLDARRWKIIRHEAAVSGEGGRDSWWKKGENRREIFQAPCASFFRLLVLIPAFFPPYRATFLRLSLFLALSPFFRLALFYPASVARQLQPSSSASQILVLSGKTSARGFTLVEAPSDFRGADQVLHFIVCQIVAS